MAPPDPQPGGPEQAPLVQKQSEAGVFNQLGRTLVWLEEATLMLLFLGLLGLGLAQIVMRNVWDSVPADIEIILRALVLWIALLGAAIAARRRRHIIVDLLGHYLPPRGRRLAGVAANLFTAVICLMLTWAGLLMIQLELSFQPVAVFGPFPRWLVQLPMPLAFALMASQFLMHAVEDAIGALRQQPSSSGGQP